MTLTRGVREHIISTIEASPNAETGGILIGHVDENGCAVVLRATGPGPQAERSPSRFVRDVEHVQGELERAARDLGAQGVYVGEWHSHWEADPRPSLLDVQSLVGIAEAPNYTTRCPAMIIAGLDPNTKTVAAVRSWVFPFGGRVYEVPNQSEPAD